MSDSKFKVIIIPPMRHVDDSEVVEQDSTAQDKIAGLSEAKKAVKKVKNLRMAAFLRSLYAD